AHIEIEGRAILAGKVAVVRGDGEAAASKVDRLDEEIAPRQSAKAPMHRFDPGEHTRNRDRRRPDARNTAGVALRCRRFRGRTGAVEHDSAPGRLMVDLVEAFTAEPRH